MDEKIVNCPICNSPMILRKSKVGNQFYGCSNYPSCKGIRQFTPDKIQRTEFQNKIFEPNKYQQVIFDEVQSGKNSLIVTACAGSGKTTTIERLASLLPKSSRVLYTVFNTKVRDEALRRMPINVTVLTTHQLGLQTITSYLKRKPVVNEDKVFKLTKDMMGQRWELDRYLISPVIKIVGLLKNTLSEPNPLEVQNIIGKFNIDIKDEDFERTIDLAIKVFHLSNKITDLIDYDDMLFLPYYHKMDGSKYDWVLTDECFPYKVPVLMENNINLPIGKIVEEKIEGRVLTYNVETGVQEYKKIINWHKIPNSKRLVKVLGVQFPNCNGGQRAAITCTDNHRIFTKEDGWVEAKDLIPGYHHIQSETSAKTSQSYKITGNGKKVLSETITENNKIKKTGNLDGKCFSNGFETNRGGNGKGLTEPQRIYLDRLGIGWFAEYVVIPTKEQRLEYKGATHYKIDIANPTLKIAIELDRSLTIASRIYKKKDKILEELGWKVYHFENNFAVQNLENIVSEVYKNDCPVWCMVTSVNEAIVNEFYVYDITIEDNHNFYANSVLVHNCQDFNNAQIQLVLNSLNGNDSKSVGVGDENQAIYGFRGASIDAMDKVRKGLKAEPYPLSITYRVPLSGVAYVNRRFPYIQFEGSPSKEDGVIDNIDNVTFTRNVKPGDMVLCRTNAPLVEPAFNLIRQGKKVTIVGRDIGNGLIEFIDRFKTGDINTLLEKMYNYRDKEQVKLAIAGKYMQLQILLDKIATIEALSDGCLTVQNITKKIGSVFSDTTQGVVFSTVHRAKGLEADNVYILYPDIIPHPMAQTSWEKRQEENLAYVAYTRHKKELHFIGEQNLLL